MLTHADSGGGCCLSRWSYIVYSSKCVLRAGASYGKIGQSLHPVRHHGQEQPNVGPDEIREAKKHVGTKHSVGTVAGGTRGTAVERHRRERFLGSDRAVVPCQHNNEERRPLERTMYHSSSGGASDFLLHLPLSIKTHHSSRLDYSRNIGTTTIATTAVASAGSAYPSGETRPPVRIHGSRAGNRGNFPEGTSPSKLIAGAVNR